MGRRSSILDEHVQSSLNVKINTHHIGCVTAISMPVTFAEG